MAQSSTNNKTANQEDFQEFQWYYVQPAFKQLKFVDWALGTAAFVGAVAFLYAVDPDLMLDSPWVLVILPFLAFLICAIILILKPHRQIFYRIDKFGVYSEFRQSACPLYTEADLVISLFLSLFGVRHNFYMNKHSSRSREFEWKDIVSVRANPNLNKIVVQAGLKGKLYLFTTQNEFKQVLTLVEQYVAQSRTNYD
ncbi:hypothetical protein [uncultured Turicimonas sp.]|uniref:hypothetical protein n=1 Tax=uncultured Turicimonas sp. TaxID=1918607 RepID=UPI00280585F7|nr:hypothetical protein [uncultured Turicimonas sp.]